MSTFDKARAGAAKADLLLFERLLPRGPESLARRARLLPPLARRSLRSLRARLRGRPELLWAHVRRGRPATGGVPFHERLHGCARSGRAKRREVFAPRLPLLPCRRPGLRRRAALPLRRVRPVRRRVVVRGLACGLARAVACGSRGLQ